jgi:hypothetical protein
LQEFILRIKRKGELEYFIARKYSDFAALHKSLRLELPGKILPALPKKNKSDTTTTGLFSGFTGGNDSEASSVSSVSTQLTGNPQEKSAMTLAVRGKCTSNPINQRTWVIDNC